MAGDRQLVRNAVAAYFGGSEQGSDGGGNWYQGGPLGAFGLGTAFPYLVKKGAPDSFYTAGQPPGSGWGAVMTVRLGLVRNTRDSYGGKVSGWRQRHYTTVCSLDLISYTEHLEVAEAGLDDLLNAMDDLVYADRTLGTTSDTYPTGRLITQAGEGREGITHGAWQWEVQDDRGQGRAGVEYTFDVLTMVSA